MKGKYVEEKDHTNTEANNKMNVRPTTSKFQVGHECQTSQEADSGGAMPSFAATTTKKEANNSATIDIVHRPRGHPPRFKNKPKPPIIITRDTERSMSPYILKLFDVSQMFGSENETRREYSRQRLEPELQSDSRDSKGFLTVWGSHERGGVM